MEFKPLDPTEQTALAPYFAAQKLHISDFSRAFQFMWHDALKPDFAFAANCLILREYYTGKYYFHYPLSLRGDAGEELAAIAEIETYCRNTGERLYFTNVPKSRIAALTARYAEAHLTDNRRWRDYLYLAENFKEYPGKVFSGQRNHVRKFAGLYPDWQFFKVSSSDMVAVEAFLKEYEQVQNSKHNYLATEEMKEVFSLLPYLEKLDLFAGALTAGGKIVGLSVGERCGDMVIVHVEKALRGYEGAYPFLAQQFARMFCGEEIRYLNRMDDAGDAGLRKSKLQYHPCEIVSKYNLIPHRPIDGVSQLPLLHAPRLTLREVPEEDAAEYARLAKDVDRNRYWGYDWRTDWNGDGAPENDWFLEGAKEDFKARREMPLGIYWNGALVGETTLHRFGYTAEAEIGVRLFPEYEGRGFAAEAVSAYAEYAFLKLNLDRMEAKCFRENERSRRMLSAAGFRKCGENETYYFFEKTPEM